MGRPDEGVILNIDGYKFKKARKDQFTEEDSIFCAGSSKSAVCFSFSVSVMEKLIKELKDNPELQKKFNIEL